MLALLANALTSIPHGACAASQCNGMSQGAKTSAMRDTFWMDPTSLFTAMTETIRTSSSKACSRALILAIPSCPTGTSSTKNPSWAFKARAAAKTHLCSIVVTRILLRFEGARRASPNKARLLASVAPEVKMISSESAPMRLATEAAASCTASCACHPTAWSLE